MREGERKSRRLQGLSPEFGPQDLPQRTRRPRKVEVTAPAPVPASPEVPRNSESSLVSTPFVTPVVASPMPVVNSIVTEDVSMADTGVEMVVPPGVALFPLEDVHADVPLPDPLEQTVFLDSQDFVTPPPVPRRGFLRRILSLVGRVKRFVLG